MSPHDDVGHNVGTSAIGRGLSAVATFVLRRLLSGLKVGRLVVITPSGGRITHQAPGATIEATLVIHRWRAIRRLISGGTISFSAAYADGDWSSPDLVGLLELAAHNIYYAQWRLPHFLATTAILRLRQRLRANTRTGSRRNVSDHYDLGNAFFRSWLDEDMNYSSGLFGATGKTLEAAQDAKLQRVVDFLELNEQNTVLEIGCGWGALAVRLAPRVRRLVGLTLSSQQLLHARDVVARRDLQKIVDLRLADYREIGGTFDRIVSIEMLEAVGERFWQTYFDTLSNRLSADGRVVLQVITIKEDLFNHYRTHPDFIQRHIFPGGMLPTRRGVLEHARRAGFELICTEAFGESYAATLAAWRRRFEAAWPELRKLGFDVRFRRLWRYYLAYCEVGFRMRMIDVGLYVLKRTKAVGAGCGGVEAEG